MPTGYTEEFNYNLLRLVPVPPQIEIGASVVEKSAKADLIYPVRVRVASRKEGGLCITSRAYPSGTLRKQSPGNSPDPARN